jgi:carboxypeptidase Taq
LAAVLVGHPPEDLKSSTRAPVQAERAFQELRAAIRRLRDLEGVIHLLEWDEETYRPRDAADDRASQLAVLGALRHDLLAGDRLGDLLGACEGRADLAPHERAELARLARQRRAAVALPQSLVAAFAETRSHCLAAWEEARRADDYRVFLAAFEPLLRLMRERAEAIRLSDDLYDALLDEHEPGMRRSRLEPLLQLLGTQLRTLVPRLAERTRRYLGLLPRGPYGEPQQWQFCAALLGDMGFDFARGRLDRSTHPFTMMAGEHDIRLTIRTSAEDPLRAIFAALHEGGHALYDQGLPPQLHGTLLADAPSMGMHESQARLWENHVGRSAAFWRHYFAKLQAVHAPLLAGLDARGFHRAINVVVPGVNRVGADEATYNLHVLVRYELEIALLTGELAAADLPGAWDERYRHYLGVSAPTPRDGCLQDVHWALGEFGYFPTYTIGNLYAASLLRALEAHRPDLWVSVEAGEFAPILGWLRENVHRHGHRWDAADLVRRIAGERDHVEDLLAYLWQRHGALHGLQR